MKKIVKISLVIILLVSITLISFKYVENIEADSGWDSSYDSGGSSSSGSSFGGSSGSSSDGTTEIDSFTFLLIIIIICIAVGIKNKKLFKNQTKEEQKKQPHKSILYDEERLKRRETYLSNKTKDYLPSLKNNEIIPNFDIEEFNFKAYQIFYDVQMSWMNFDYDKLKDLLTDELYNNYVMQLDALKLKNHKNTMKDFELIGIRLSSLKEENDKYIAEVHLNVKFYDYVENIKTGMILRGTPNRKLNNIYKLTFIRTKEETNNINECPQCGAPVEGNSTGICEYCKSKLINGNYNWVMSKKEIVKQK